MSAPLVIPSVFTAIDRFSAPMKRMTSNMEAFAARSQRALNWANQGFNKLIAPITSLNNMLMGLGFYVGLYGLVRVVKNAIDIFADFQQANTDLAIVMGVTVKQNKVLADEARRIGLNYGISATEVVKMQHALATLGFEQADILKMGRPLITGASALEGADPERLANVVGATINAFDKLTPTNTQHILDVMALASNRTALNFEKLATTIPIVAGPANAINVQFEEMVALLGVLQNSGIHVATSATSLKNIFIDTKKQGGHGYVAFLNNVIKHVDKLTFANKKVGKRSVVSALALATHLNDEKNGVIALTKEFEKATSGLTELMATQRLDTFRGAQKLLNASWTEFILSIEDGTGPLAQSLTRILKVASAVLLLSSDSDQAREAIKKLDGGILDSAKSWQSWLKWIGYIVGGLIILKGILWISGILLGVYNVAIAVWTGLTYVATGAMWLFNAALAANPIGLIIIGLSALMILLLEMIDNWKTWGAAVSYLFGPIGTLISFIQTLHDRWDMVKKAFSGEGIISGLKAIGKVILESMLYPMQQMAQIMYSLSGIKAFDNAAKAADLVRKYLTEDTQTPLVNPKATEQQNWMQMIQGGNIGVDFSNVPNGTKITSSSPNIMPKVNSTQDASFYLRPSY